MDRSYKHCFPFRLATTSFIYPDTYSANVRRLGHWVDEIELLLFESSQIPSRSEIDELRQLAGTLDITYNVHLPLDIEMDHPDTDVKDQSIQMVVKAIERTAPLQPTTYTLHLVVNDAIRTGDIAAWQARMIASISQTLASVTIASRLLSVETLDYNPQWLKPICDRLDLAVCLDVGHVLLYGFDLQDALDAFGERIAIWHLHGVHNGKDHLSLDQLDPQVQRTIGAHLRHFTGSVSLEVFSEVNLKHSLDCLARLTNQAHRS